MSPDLILHYDKASMRPAAADAADGHASVWLRMLRGEDDIAISEAMLNYDENGRAKVSNAASEVVKLCRSVARLEGLEIAGDVCPALDDATYRKMPRWMVVKIRLAANLQELDLAKDQALPE